MTANRCSKATLAQIEQILDETMKLFYHCWEDSMDSIVSEIRAHFAKLLKIATIHFSHEQGKSDPFVSRVTRELLQASSSTKGKYSLLSVLVDHVGYTTIAELEPSFFRVTCLATR